jgi:hypothetical protein
LFPISAIFEKFHPARPIPTPAKSLDFGPDGLRRCEHWELSSRSDRLRDAADTYQSYSYQYWDGAIQSGISFDSDTGSSTNALWTTTYGLDASGHVTTATIADGQPRTANFLTDQNGMVIERTETKNSGNTTSAGSPTTLHYLFGGQQIGEASNNGTDPPVGVFLHPTRHAISATAL